MLEHFGEIYGQERDLYHSMKCPNIACAVKIHVKQTLTTCVQFGKVRSTNGALMAMPLQNTSFSTCHSRKITCNNNNGSVVIKCSSKP